MCKKENMFVGSMIELEMVDQERRSQGQWVKKDLPESTKYKRGSSRNSLPRTAPAKKKRSTKMTLQPSAR